MPIGNPKGTRGGRREGSGRKRGALSQAKLDLRKAAMPYAEDALKTVVKIMKDKKARHSDRLTAANIILDRGFGRPIQAHRVGGLRDNPLAIIAGTMDPKEAERLYTATLHDSEE